MSTRGHDAARAGFRRSTLLLLVIGMTVALFGCVSPGPPSSSPDPAAQLRTAFDDLVGQMVLQVGERERNIGVTPPEGEHVVSAYLQDEIIAAFIRAQISGLSVYERTHINVLLEEATLGISGLVSEESAMEVGNMVGVDAMVVGATRTIEDQLVVNTRVIDVETGRIIGAGSVSLPSALLRGVDDAESPASILNRSFQVVDLVLNVEPPPEMTVHRITTYDGIWTEYNGADEIMARGTIRNITDSRIEIHWMIPEHFTSAVYNYHRTPDTIVARVVVNDHEIGYLEFTDIDD